MAEFHDNGFGSVCGRSVCQNSMYVCKTHIMNMQVKSSEGLAGKMTLN